MLPSDVYKSYGSNPWARDFKKAVYFDMDGTIADLFEVPNWLERLRAYDADVYREAKPKIDPKILYNFAESCRQANCRIGVISWLAAVTTPEFDDAAIMAKMDWLSWYMPEMDEVLFMPYGYDKLQYVDVKENSILIDDSARNRNAWVDMSANRNAFDVYALPQLFGHIEKMFFTDVDDNHNPVPK